jgi:hypothetical protein
MFRDKVKAYRRKTILKEQEEQERAEAINNEKMLEALLRKAIKRLDLTIAPYKRGMIEVTQLNNPQQINILEKYINQIDYEIQKFRVQWGNDVQVKNAINWFQVERGNALEQIARLKTEQQLNELEEVVYGKSKKG